MRRSPAVFLALVAALCTLSCLSSRGVGPRADAPLELVDAVDLERFAGRWYVIESMPTAAEAGAHAATEDYALRDDGRIDITFRFRKDALDGPEETLHMLGWPVDASGAEWRVRPFWPLRLAYLILELGEDYDYTVVGHPSKRYVWIMSRSPSIAADLRTAIRGRLAEAGYDVDRIRAVPQRSTRHP